MKIISTPAKWTKQVVCPSCNALLEVDESDITIVNTAVAYAGETRELEVGVVCGVCHTFFEVKQLPSGIRQAAEDAWDKRLSSR